MWPLGPLAHPHKALCPLNRPLTDDPYILHLVSTIMPSHAQVPLLALPGIPNASNCHPFVVPSTNGTHLVLLNLLLWPSWPRPSSSCRFSLGPFAPSLTIPLRTLTPSPPLRPPRLSTNHLDPTPSPMPSFAHSYGPSNTHMHPQSTTP